MAECFYQQSMGAAHRDVLVAPPGLCHPECCYGVAAILFAIFTLQAIEQRGRKQLALVWRKSPRFEENLVYEVVHTFRLAACQHPRQPVMALYQRPQFQCHKLDVPHHHPPVDQGEGRLRAGVKQQAADGVVYRTVCEGQGTQVKQGQVGAHAGG